MTDSNVFIPWPKIPRKNKVETITITEKIDGTNGQINIVPFSEATTETVAKAVDVVGDYLILAGSRTRYVTPEQDNFGFAKWVKENAEELAKLGHGRHYGEWYGQGIQRGYGLSERRFALFNSLRWGEHNPNTPACCEVVPTLYHGITLVDIVEETMKDLKKLGSSAALGFMEPEGVIVYSHTFSTLRKLTYEHIEGKWKEA